MVVPKCNFDDIAFIPTHAALKLFNDDKLLGIRTRASSRVSVNDAVAEITDILKDRRDGGRRFYCYHAALVDGQHC